jgi:hypothetical protein
VLRRVLVMRGAVVVFAVGASIVAFMSGEEIFGALLAALAITNVILITFFASRDAVLRRNPPEPQPPPRRPN